MVRQQHHRLTDWSTLSPHGECSQLKNESFLPVTVLSPSPAFTDTGSEQIAYIVLLTGGSCRSKKETVVRFFFIVGCRQNRSEKEVSRLRQEEEEVRSEKCEQEDSDFSPYVKNE